jgi:hypothetical protein
MGALIRAAGREPAQRTTLYAPVAPELATWKDALPLATLELTPLRRRASVQQPDQTADTSTGAES